MARRRVKLSEIRNLARLQCTQSEACGFLGISPVTFKKILKTDSRARAAWEDGHKEGCVSLRRKQFRLAGKHAGMAIFLGKQYLGQTDIVVNEHSGRDGGPIQTFDLKKLDAKDRKKLRALLELARKPDRSSD